MSAVSPIRLPVAAIDPVFKSRGSLPKGPYLNDVHIGWGEGGAHKAGGCLNYILCIGTHC